MSIGVVSVVVSASNMKFGRRVYHEQAHKKRLKNQCLQKRFKSTTAVGSLHFRQFTRGFRKKQTPPKDFVQLLPKFFCQPIRTPVDSGTGRSPTSHTSTFTLGGMSIIGKKISQLKRD